MSDYTFISVYTAMAASNSGAKTKGNNWECV